MTKRVLILMIVALGVTASVKPGRADCMVRAIGVDAATSDTTAPAWYGRGQAQGFNASDSLIAAITVWSPPRGYQDFQPRRLFICGAFPDGTIDNTDRVYGPRDLVVTTSDINNPIAYRYDFVPPIRLPTRGEFAVVVQALCGNSFPLLANTRNPYSGGQLCRTGPVFDCSVPGGPFCDDSKGWDLCFKIEFCSDATGVGQPRASNDAFRLSPPVPNPSGTGAVVELTLAREARVDLVVFDSQGRRERTIHEGRLPAGVRQLAWDGRSDTGSQVDGGVYFMRVTAGGGVATRQVVLRR